MRPAALVFLFAALVHCAGAAPDLKAVRNNGIDYVSLEEGAARLGLRIERLVPPTAVLLKDGSKPVARLVDHSRETDINGLRVFFGDPVIEIRGAFYLSRIDYDTHLVPRLRPELCLPIPQRPRVIAVDAGHGGLDRGTENPALGTMEKTYTLDVAKRLKALLEAAGYKVVMTRESDVTVVHEQRFELANKAGADLFISIHFNSLFPNTKTTGVEILTYPPRTQRSTESWSPGKKDDSRNPPEPINSFDQWSTVLGGIEHRRLLEAMHSSDRGAKLEHLKALAGLKCPAVLVEPAFLSSSVEGARLAQPAYRDTIAAAVFAGVQEYAELLGRLRPPAVTAPVVPTPAAPSGTPAPALRSPPTRPAPGP
jgi:N-acetylmuramoyl-L-alanine amidase